MENEATEGFYGLIGKTQMVLVLGAAAKSGCHVSYSPACICDVWVWQFIY